MTLKTTQRGKNKDVRYECDVFRGHEQTNGIYLTVTLDVIRASIQKSQTRPDQSKRLNNVKTSFQLLFCY